MHGSKCTGCTVAGYVSVAVYLVLTLITLYALYNTHFTTDGMFVAGSMDGSLAIIAFAFSFKLLMKAFKKACPCGCASGCCGSGCGCGGSCDCGDKGMQK